MEDQTPANLENGNDEVDIKTEPITEEIKENEETGQKEGALHAKKEERVNDDVNKESDVVAADNKSEKTHQNNKNKATKQDTKPEKGFRRDSKVHPADGHVAPQIQTNESTEKTKTVEPPKKEIIMELDPEKKRVLGIKLLNLISHKGKKEDIIVLIQGGAQVDMKNETLLCSRKRDTWFEFLKKEIENFKFKNLKTAGWQPMHFAAAAGSVAIINALIENKAKPNCYDNNFQTPLHVAARRGQVASVIALVAHGTQVETRDWEGNAPLELAVTGRHVRVVETLFLFGAEPNLNDWSWTMKDENKFTKDELAILTLFGNQLPKVPGYKYGGISKDVGYLKPGKSHNFEECCANMLVEQAKTPFFAFCCKMQSEYADLKSYLKEDQSPFSDMYECRYWGLSYKIATFTLTIEGQPSANEITDFVSPQGKIGRVDNIEKKEEENQTIVTITLKLAKEATRFALALRREPEKFQITKEAVTIQPKNEPDAAIDIPEGTFDKAAELQLNVVETKDVNEDEESGPILMTNVIDMSMSDGQQPNKGIDMKLPIHSKDQNEVFDLCVLATSEEEPDDIDDWEIIEAKPDKSGKAAVFKIEHFSIYAGASKKKVEKEKEEVIKAVIRSMKRTRKVEFTVYIQTDSTKRGVFQLIVEVTSPKKTDKRKSHWLKQGYTIQGQKEEKEYEVEEKQRFVLSFYGNIANKGKEDQVFLDYESKKKSKYLALEMEAKDFGPETTDLTGRLRVEMEIEIEVTKTEIVPDGLCKTKSVEVKTPQAKLEEMVWLDIGMTFPKEEPVVPLEKILPQARKSAKPRIRRQSTISGISGDIDEQVLIKEYDKDNTIPSLGVSKFLTIAERLNPEEVHYLGLQLLNREKLTEIMEADADTSKIAFNILMKYRGKRPHMNQVGSIIKAFTAIDRRDLARIIDSPEDRENIGQYEASQGTVKSRGSNAGVLDEPRQADQQPKAEEESVLVTEDAPKNDAGTQGKEIHNVTDAEITEAENNP